MRLLTTVLLIWPITAIGGTTPDALPPWGVWKCNAEAQVDCEWDEHEKLPDCKLENIDDSFEPICIDLRSTPYVLYVLCNKEFSIDLRYLGPEDGMWSLGGAGPFGGIFLMGINPGKNNFRLIVDPWGDYEISDGSCINVTPKDEEKKPAIESKDKDTTESSVKD